MIERWVMLYLLLGLIGGLGWTQEVRSKCHAEPLGRKMIGSVLGGPVMAGLVFWGIELNCDFATK